MGLEKTLLTEETSITVSVIRIQKGIGIKFSEPKGSRKLKDLKKYKIFLERKDGKVILYFRSNMGSSFNGRTVYFFAKTTVLELEDLVGKTFELNYSCNSKETIYYFEVEEPEKEENLLSLYATFKYKKKQKMEKVNLHFEGLDVALIPPKIFLQYRNNSVSEIGYTCECVALGNSENEKYFSRTHPYIGRKDPFLLIPYTVETSAKSKYIRIFDVPTIKNLEKDYLGKTFQVIKTGEEFIIKPENVVKQPEVVEENCPNENKNEVIVENSSTNEDKGNEIIEESKINEEVAINNDKKLKKKNIYFNDEQSSDKVFLELLDSIRYGYKSHKYSFGAAAAEALAAFFREL